MINKEQRIKELDIQVAELKSDIEALKKDLAEKESAAAADRHEATVARLREELEQAQTLLGMAEAKGRQLAAALSSRDRELRERDKIIREKDLQLQSDQRKIKGLSAKARSGKVAKICVPVLLLALLACMLLLPVLFGKREI